MDDEDYYKGWDVDEDLIEYDNGPSVIISKELQNQRRAICESCPSKNKYNGCSECGCWLPMKILFGPSKCPLDKWPKI